MGVKYTGAVGKKFNADMTAREFPGNTIICHVPPDSPTHEFLQRFQADLKIQPWAAKYSFLPPSSFHMTVFEGVCDQVRRPGVWPHKLPLDASLEEVDAMFTREWATIDKPEGFQVKYHRAHARGTLGIQVQPVDAAMEARMRTFRDLLAVAFGIRTLGHAHYGFHITFAYKIIQLSLSERVQANRFIRKHQARNQEEFGVLTFRAPEITFFADMTDFAPSRGAAQRNRVD
jgi:hypothetical protein